MLHEAKHECTCWGSWFSIHESCGLTSNKETPIMLFEDNATCIALINSGYIKIDKTLSSELYKLFYIH